MRLLHEMLSACLAAVLLACASDPVALASERYRATRDASSLEVICGALRSGMTRSEVEGWVGEPAYSPVPGQDYYASDRRSPEGIYGLVVEYRRLERDGSVTETDRLQEFRCEAIGE